MSATAFIGGGDEATFISATTPCANIGTGQTVQVSAANVGRVQTPLRKAGVLSNLRILIAFNLTGTGKAWTHRLYKNGASANQNIPVAAFVTGALEDVTNTDTVTAGDLFHVQLDSITGSGVAAWGSQILKFDPTATGDLYYRGAGYPSAQSVASQPTGFMPIFGTGINGSTVLTSEAQVQSYLPKPCTLRDLYAYVQTNTVNGASTVVSRVNGATGTLTITIPSTTSGLFEDTSNTDTLVEGDLVCLSSVLGGASGSYAAFHAGAAIVSSNGIIPWIASAGGPAVVAANTRGWAPFAPNVFEERYGFLTTVASQLGIYVTSNGVGSCFYRVSVNAVDTALALAIPGSMTGRFENNITTINLVPTDKLSIKLIAGLGTSFGYTYTYLVYGAPASGPLGWQGCWPTVVRSMRR